MSGNSEQTEKLNELFVSWSKIGALVLVVSSLLAAFNGE